MAIADVAAIQKALKVVYPDRKVKFVGYQGNPLLALLPKNDKFEGKQMDIAIWYGGNQGLSRDFATAKTNKTSGLYENFSLVRKSDYGLTSISNEAILASRSSDAAFLKMAVSELDNTVRGVSRNYAISLYGNIGGARGQIAVGGISGTALTLMDPTQVVNFEKGMVLVNDVTDGSSVAQTGTGVATITAVDRRLGILYASAWTNFSASHYLFRQGDYGASIAGLSSWIPATTPGGSDSFLGCNRSVDTRLYGMYHDGSAQTMEEALQDLEAKLSAEGGEPDYVFCNPKDFNILRKNLGSSVVFDKVKSPDMATVSFAAIKLYGIGTTGISIVADRNCPVGVAYMLDMKTWEACTLDGGPRILESMGMKFIWDTNSDSIEARVGYYGNLGCHAPGFNGRVKLSTAV